MKRMLVWAALVALMLAVTGPVAYAQVVLGPVKAIANATVQPAGPRAAPNGTNFFNVEGNANGANASFGTADFAAFSRPGPVSAVSSVTVSVIESNAAFTAPGPLNFYFAADTSRAVTPGDTSPGRVVFQPGTGSEGVGTQLGALMVLGSGTFNTTGNPPGSTGTVDTFTFNSLSAATSAYIVGQLNSNLPFRLVITPGNDAVAATWSGFSNTAAGLTNSPTLGFNVSAVPEPSSFVLAGLAAAAFAYRRRRQTN